MEARRKGRKTTHIFIQFNPKLEAQFIELARCYTAQHKSALPIYSCPLLPPNRKKERKKGGTEER